MCDFKYWIVNRDGGACYAAKNRDEAINIVNSSNAMNMGLGRNAWFDIEVEDDDPISAHYHGLKKREKMGDKAYFGLY